MLQEHLIPMMGYDVERFVSPVNDGLLCCICRDVLEDPLQASCEHAYCRSCIEGWLVQETTCPEDRKPLSLDQLRPLFRYMRKDLDKLQVRCQNRVLGCTHIGDLEFIVAHESECVYGTTECKNVGCDIVTTRQELDDHLSVCKFRDKVCERGCGVVVAPKGTDEHSCFSELRTAVELLRSEMVCRLDDHTHQMQLRLDAQRSHMVDKETGLQAQINQLKSENDKLSQRIALLLDYEMRRQEESEDLADDSGNNTTIELVKNNQSDENDTN